MKLKYEKPMAIVEDYKLSQSIAACSIQIQSTNSWCFLNDPDTPAEVRAFASENWFIDEANCPDNYPKGMDEYDGLCYHTSMAYMFTS